MSPDAQKALENLRRDKDNAIGSQQYEMAAELRDREVQLQGKIKNMEQENGRILRRKRLRCVTKKTSPKSSACGRVSGIQPTMTKQRLLKMEEALHKRIVGQDEAITHFQGRAPGPRRLKDPRRPIGNFIFPGPTGVGKTELARSLAEFMFGSEDALVRIDMSEFMEKIRRPAGGRASRIRRL